MKRRFFLFVLSIPLFFIIGAPSCEKNIPDHTEDVIIVEADQGIERFLFEFKGDYLELWKTVDSLQNLGLYDSALKTVQAIYRAAEKDQNTPQQIKSLIHQMKFTSYIKEDDLVLSLNALDSLSTTSSFPLKQLISSVTADSYWNFYQRNRWRFMHRSTTETLPDDIRTWSLEQLHARIRTHYLNSLSATDSLQKTSITDFEDILIIGESNSNLRPTLYDFLAHRALDYFQNPESGITRPDDPFRITGRNYFGNAHEFLQTDIRSNDSLSNLNLATKLYLDLTRFHLNDQNPVALIDLELHRLKFAYHHSIDDTKDERFTKALELLESKYQAIESSTEVLFQLASHYQTKTENKELLKQGQKSNQKRAAEICEEAIARFPKSFGAEQCRELLKVIRYKQFSFETEEVYEPGSNLKMLVRYKNIDSLYFKVVRIPDDFYFKLEKYGKDLISELQKLKSIQSWDQKLVKPNDFLEHSTEIMVKPLDLGHYMVLASHKKDFPLNSNAISYGSFWVSRLNLSYRRNGQEELEVVVNDIATGKPLKGVQADILIRKYNYLSRNYDIIKQESYRSDEYGMFTVKSKSDYRYLYIDLSFGKDHYNNQQQVYQYRPYHQDKPNYTTHFFTDRSIYRPGQTVHFKGIRIKHSGDDHQIDPNQETTVHLYDVNYQKVSDLKLITNEYGTFSGSFVLPSGGITGMMHLEDPYGNRYFSVEEYKRPKFEVSIDKLQGAYKIGEEIEVPGKAISYSGAAVDGATVSYRITRGASFPHWIWYRWGVYPNSPQTEIGSGNMKTDENGKFKINFTAKEDPLINKKYSPTYHYTIEASVTDLNGETQSSTQYVYVAHHALNLALEIGSAIDRKVHPHFKLHTTNLNGEKTPAQGKVVVHRLKEPEKIMRSSFWERPDIQTFDKESYRKLFPNDIYAEENNYAKFEKAEEVLSLNFDTKKSDSLTFNKLSTWKPGRYLITLTSTDAYGMKVEDLNYITVLDPQQSVNPTAEIWSFFPLKVVADPGEKATFLLSTAEKNMHVLYEVEHKNQIVKRELIILSNEQRLINLPIEEKHRGNLVVHFTVVKDGRTYNHTQTVIVPFSNKQLDISFETFRDKLKPGDEEEWKINIKGPKNEKVVAEMLAAMYDASLDAFAPNNFYLSVFNSFYSNRYWQQLGFRSSSSQVYHETWNEYADIQHRIYDELNWWGYPIYYGSYGYGDYYSYDGDERLLRQEGLFAGALEETETVADMAMVTKYDKKSENQRSDKAKNRDSAGGLAMPASEVASGEIDQSIMNGQNLGGIKARSNFAETAFFFPHLESNTDGSVSIKFTIPESLTKWKFMALAHTKDLKIGFTEREVLTQKELMVIPNAPRFFREGDQLIFSTKISNLTDSVLVGEAQLFLFDALTMQPVDQLFNNIQSVKTFTCAKGESSSVDWNIFIPVGIGAVTYRVVAKAKNHTDGEEMAVPILSNRILVTESLPLPMRDIGTKAFSFHKLINSKSSSSISHHKLTLEYTSNPAWYAIQAMPYMMEYPYECAEQVFTRYYANSIASNLMNSNPKIKQVFDSWKSSSPDAFLSNLQKNEELKSLILEETPWVLDAKNESERKKRIGLLFDLNKMDHELQQAMKKLEKMQVSNGGWPWFPGMPESRYITQHVVTGLGHLDNLGVKQVREDRRVWQMLTKAVNYLDGEIIRDYEWLKKHDPQYLSEQRISQTQVQYLYSRSYFKDLPINKRLEEALFYYQKQAASYWKNFDLYNEGMIALQAHRFEKPTLAKQILASIKERSIKHEELGMYWKDNVSGYYWYQAPIETQALLIEAFDEILQDETSVDDMKVWLLKQKQTSDWKTTKATAEACYALLLRGSDFLSNEEVVEIRVNQVLIDPKALGQPVEAGTGYFKHSWSGNEIKPEMGNVSVTRKTKGVSWGAMYWQYFEDLDKITPHETPLKLKKQLYLVTNTPTGPVLKAVSGNKLKIGDKVRVRIELRCDRDMDFVHMKDMRASGFEPLNVFSRYKWQDGLGYYESTRDAATNFFFDRLTKGTYVFEYDVRVTHKGDFSNGITTIQSMYAPEFTSHSEGVRVNVE